MTNQTNSKILAPADIYKVLKAAHENGRLEDNLGQIAREIAQLDPAYLARIEQMKAESSDAIWVEAPKRVSDAVHKAAQPWSGYSIVQKTQMMWDAFIQSAPVCPSPSKNPDTVFVPAVITKTMFDITRPYHFSKLEVVQAMWEKMLIAAGVDASVFEKAKEAAKTDFEAELPADPLASNNVQIRKLEWTLINETWKCFTNDEYTITCWWETDEIKTPRDPNDPHYFLIDDDDNERYGTIEEAMEAAQTMFETAANSYLVTPIAKPTEDESFAAGREKGLREGAKIAGDFVWRLYKRDGVVTSHEYEKVSEAILEQIDHPTTEDEPNVSISPR